MVWIKRKISFYFYLFLLLFPAHGQSTDITPKSLETERTRLEALVKITTNDTERHTALRMLARLEQLGGAYEAAAAYWTEAAYARSGNRDDEALLEAAGCYISIGELDKAMADVTTVLLSVKDAALLSKARYLGAQIEALRGESGSQENLLSMIGDPDYAERQSAILFLLFRISGETSYAEALKNRYPESTESLLLKQETVQLKALPYWYFPVNRTALELVQVQKGDNSGPYPGHPVDGAETEKSELQDTQIQETAETTDTGLLGLQVGLFSSESNARLELQRLSAKGFTGRIVNRTVNGVSYWAVLVPVASDTNSMIIKLKDAGFESFPVFSH